MGMIMGRLGEYGQAVAYLEQVLYNFPGTLSARRAAVERLRVLYAGGEPEEAVLLAESAFGYNLPRKEYVLAALTTGDAYMALQIPEAAYDSYLKAYSRAGSERRDSEIVPRVRAAVSQFSQRQLRREIDGTQERFPAAILLYQLGLSYEGEGRFGEAIAVLSQFLDRFPGHLLAEDARERVEAIEAAGYGDEIRIGCLLPLTGRYERFGRRVLNGVELAMSLSEEDGNGALPPVTLMVADTASDPDKTAAALRELDRNRVTLVIGPLATAKSAAAAAQESGIPIIVLTQEDGLPAAGSYVFRNFITPRLQVEALADYAYERLGVRRYAMLYPDEPYGSAFMHLFWDALLAREASVTGLEKYDPAHTDFSDSIKKLVGLYYELPEDIREKEQEGPVTPESPFPGGIRGERGSHEGGGGEAGPWRGAVQALLPEGVMDPEPEEEKEPEPVVDFGAVFIPDSSEKAGLIIPQLAYYDIEGIVPMGTHLWHSERFIRMAPRHVQGAVCPSGFFPESPKRPVRRFVSAYGETYGEKPEFLEAIGYDTARMAIALMRNAKYLGRHYVAQELKRMPPYEGVTGSTWFDAEGEGVKELYLLKVSGTRFVEVK
jgi:ABC-type branched-subunit amino acid transport system substrate-binding protein